eukprot:5465825-Amphidinium_carterae.1
MLTVSTSNGNKKWKRGSQSTRGVAKRWGGLETPSIECRRRRPMDCLQGAKELRHCLCGRIPSLQLELLFGGSSPER